jgi:hypothetical protein
MGGHGPENTVKSAYRCADSADDDDIVFHGHLRKIQGCECCIAAEAGTRFGGILIIPQCSVNGRNQEKTIPEAPGVAN